MKNLLKIIGFALMLLSLNACIWEPDEIGIKHELYGEWVQVNDTQGLEGRKVFISESEATITALPTGHRTKFQIGDILMERLRSIKGNRYYCTALHLSSRHGTMKKSGKFVEILSETSFRYTDHDMQEGAIFEKLNVD